MICNVLATARSQALALLGNHFQGRLEQDWTVARMGTLSVEGLESLLRGQDCIVLFCAGKIMCGCSKQFSSLAALADHVSRAHAKLPASRHQHQEEGVQEYFRCVWIISCCCIVVTGILFVSGKTLLFHKITRMLCP